MRAVESRPRAAAPCPRPYPDVASRQPNVSLWPVAVVEFPAASLAAVDVPAAVEAFVFPAFLVGDVVAGVAVQGCVVEVGGAAVLPGLGVLDFAPAGWPVAAGCGASAVHDG